MRSCSMPFPLESRPCPIAAQRLTYSPRTIGGRGSTGTRAARPRLGGAESGYSNDVRDPRLPNALFLQKPFSREELAQKLADATRVR